MSYPPTAEQQAAIDAFRSGVNIALEAGAGTGKTSTLKFLAAEVPMHRGVYMAYNASIAREAAREFPRNVLCKTGHGHTRVLSSIEQARMDFPKQTGPEQARILGIQPGAHRITEDVVYAGRQVARVAMETVTRFARSGDDEVSRWHVPRQTRLEAPAAHNALIDLVLPYARKAWDDLMSKTGQLRWEHDFYRKRFQMEQRTLPGKFVFLDEAQDSNGVTIAIVEHHMALGYKIVAVGDANQAINGWMGAVDAMGKFGGVRLPLTKSFRFGPAIAHEANKWLALLNSDLRITGHEPVGSTVGRLNVGTLPDAILTRTNAEAVSQAMRLQQQGTTVALVKGVGETIERLANAALQLKHRGSTDHPDLCAFDSWGQVQDFVDQDHAGADLKVFVDLIDEYSAETVIAAMKRLVTPREAQVTLSTAHRAKGLEWDTVQIAPDFKEPKADDEGGPQMPQRDEMMLAYVAVTRAKKHLDPSGLAWVDKYLPGGVEAQRLFAGAR